MLDQQMDVLYLLHALVRDDMAYLGQLRELLRGSPIALERVECVQEADGDRGR